MTERSVKHATFVIERTYDASPERVFAAFASKETKVRWFGDPEHPTKEFDLDFRVGGREFNRGGPPGGPVYTYEAIYHDIVPNERIVTTYAMQMDGTPISASAATTELKATNSGTRLIYTEQGAFLDGLDKPEIREQGCRELFDSLGTFLQRESALL
jgi:uncharacterized protein YndB with AHSA1/START domain